MPNLYSERFCLVDATGNGAHTYVVPQEKRAVVKCVCAFNSSGSSGGVGLFVAGNPVWYMPVPSLQGVTASGLMIVGYIGDAIFLSITLGVSAQMSGYLLQAPPLGASAKPIEPDTEPPGLWPFG